jgi:hypothetical protein
MMFNNVRSLCTPSITFLVVSILYMIFTITMASTNGTYPYCFTPEKCDTYLTYTSLGKYIISTIVFTIVLNIICSYGYNVIAWLLFAILMIFRHLESASIDISI